jgi:lipoprotein-anchoring transpeptidase ErfK/SrfK
VGFLAVLLILVVAALAGGAILYASDAIPPGLQTLDVQLGGRSRAQAEMALQQAWASHTVLVDIGGSIQTVRPADLGVTLDTTDTVRMAYDEGRSAAALATMLRDRQLALPVTEVQPVWRFDSGQADRMLQQMARQAYLPAVNAGIRIFDGRAESTTAMPGRALDVAVSGVMLSSDPWGTVTRGHFQPVIHQLAPAVTDTTSIVAQIDQALAEPVLIHLYDPVVDEAHDWQLSGEVTSPWITVQPAQGNGEGVDWTIDPLKVTAYLTGQAAGLGEDRYIDLERAVPAIVAAIKAPGGRVDLRIYHRDRHATVQAGDTLSSLADQYGVPYPWIQRANPSLGDDIQVGQVITIPSSDALIPLPPIENERIKVSLSAQKVWVYENGAVKWEWPASTGLPGTPTAPGIFQIQSHEQNAYASNWDLWMPFFMGVYQPVPDQAFMNGFHGFPTRGGSQLLWTNDLGHPVTYGCILLSTDNAKALYSWAREGVVVEIDH